MKTTKYVNYWIEIKIGNKFELTDELITINNGNEFVNNNNEIYPPELYFLKSPTSPTENVVLDFHFLKIRFKFKYLYIIKEIPTTSTFHIALFHQIFFFVTFVLKYFKYVSQLLLQCSLLKHLKFLLHRLLRQRAGLLGLKKKLVKIINCYIL